MNIERFHNELAMRLGYERIVNDKRIMISVEESEDPLVTLKVEGFDNIHFKASEKPENLGVNIPIIHDEIKEISVAVYEAYEISTKELFSCYNGIR